MTRFPLSEDFEEDFEKEILNNHLSDRLQESFAPISKPVNDRLQESFAPISKLVNDRLQESFAPISKLVEEYTGNFNKNLKSFIKPCNPVVPQMEKTAESINSIIRRFAIVMEPLSLQPMFDPESLEAMRESLQKVRNLVVWLYRLDQLPYNLRECADGLDDNDIAVFISAVREFVKQEGIPLYFVPRNHEVIFYLLKAKNHEKRRQILKEFNDVFIDDCDMALKQLGKIGNDAIDGLKDFIFDGINVMRDGHFYSAQAMFTVVLDTIIPYLIPDKKDQKRIINDEQNIIPNVIEFSGVKSVLVWLPIGNAHAKFWRGIDPVPVDYSRHASVHAVSSEQYNQENCIQSLMLVTSLIGYASQIDL